MPATSSSPLARPANFVVASSTTATTKPRAARAVRRATAGKRSLRAKVHRAPRCRLDEAEGTIADRRVVERRRAHRAARDAAEQMRGNDRQLGEERRADRDCGRAIAEHERRVVGGDRGVERRQLGGARDSPWPDPSRRGSVKATSRAVVRTPSCQRRSGASESVSVRRSSLQRQRRAKYGCGASDGVVAHERDEQRVALHLPRQRMHGDERVRRLEIGARRHARARRRLAAARCTTTRPD